MAEHAHDNKRPLYLKVFFALIILTALELGVVYMHVGRAALIVSLVGLALAKATVVAAYFMHLKEEARLLKLTVGVPLLVFPPLYAIVLIVEAVVRRGIF